MATIKDLAKACGVSVSTVSKALNGYHDVNPKTAEFILEKAKELHYQPSAAARRLVTNRSYIIGVLYDPQDGSGFRHEFFATILNGIKEELEKKGYDIIFLAKKVSGRDATYLEHAKYMSCDGVIVVTAGDFNSPEVQELVKSDLPLVSVDYSFEGHSSVLSDNIDGGYNMMNYLIENGHRTIGIIHGEETLVTRKRLNGIHRALREHNMEISDDYIKLGHFHSTVDSEKATLELMKLATPPTAIMYPDDFAYIGGRMALEQLHLKSPEDVSVCGYDGIYLSEVIRPRLATYYQDGTRMGVVAADKLLEHVETPDACVVEQITVSGHLQEGDSVRSI